MICTHNHVLMSNAMPADLFVISDLWMYALGDDKVTVYADEELVGRTSIWNEVKLMRIPRPTTVIALEVYDYYGDYVTICQMGNFATDRTWKCTYTKEDYWNIPSHDISHWPLAQVITSNLVKPPFKSAKGIWASGSQGHLSYSYCVKNIGKWCW